MEVASRPSANRKTITTYSSPVRKTNALFISAHAMALIKYDVARHARKRLVPGYAPEQSREN
jgi:hypothetical protein